MLIALTLCIAFMFGEVSRRWDTSDLVNSPVQAQGSSHMILILTPHVGCWRSDRKIPRPSHGRRPLGLGRHLHPRRPLHHTSLHEDRQVIPHLWLSPSRGPRFPHQCPHPATRDRHPGLRSRLEDHQFLEGGARGSEWDADDSYCHRRDHCEPLLPLCPWSPCRSLARPWRRGGA